MTLTGEPLTGAVATCEPAKEAAVGNKVQVPAINGISLPFGISIGMNSPSTSQIVGLYTGGVRTGCGIFHPTGTCMMRNHQPEVSMFCHVCRYALVDLIDPTRHGTINIDYEGIYPH
jgi:hypothetical protein